MPISCLDWTDDEGVAWRVWDILSNRRVFPGVHVVEQRAFVRASDGWAYACDVNPRAGPSPTHHHYLQWQLRGGLDSDPVRARAESDADYAARCKAHRIAHTAARRAAQLRSWAEDEERRRAKALRAASAPADVEQWTGFAPKQDP